MKSLREDYGREKFELSMREMYTDDIDFEHRINDMDALSTFIAEKVIDERINDFDYSWLCVHLYFKPIDNATIMGGLDI